MSKIEILFCWSVERFLAMTSFWGYLNRFSSSLISFLDLSYFFNNSLFSVIWAFIVYYFLSCLYLFMFSTFSSSNSLLLYSFTILISLISLMILTNLAALEPILEVLAALAIVAPLITALVAEPVSNRASLIHPTSSNKVIVESKSSQK